MNNPHAGETTVTTKNEKIPSTQTKLFYRKSQATTKRGYYKIMDLLTSKSIFDNEFGNKPHMFSSWPNSASKSKNKEATMKYLGLWKIDIFLAVW